MRSSVLLYHHQDHPGSRDPHLRCASVKGRLPYAGRGVRPGQISVALAFRFCAAPLAQNEQRKVPRAQTYMEIPYSSNLCQIPGSSIFTILRACAHCRYIKVVFKP